MYIENVKDLDSSTVLSPDLFEELFALPSEIDRTRTYLKILDRAKELNVKVAFDKLYKSYEKEFKKIEKAQKVIELREQSDVVKQQNVTNFSTLKTQFECGDWNADDNGIWIHTEKGQAYACYHPVYPTRILRNSETNKYKIELEYIVRGKLRKTLVDREMIVTPQKIVKLANDSIQVNSINAPYLVKFLTDVEAKNPDLIVEYASTSRLGWVQDSDDTGEKVYRFLPYDKEDIVFDNESVFNSLFNSVKAVGNRDKWYETVKGIRAKKQTEVLINMAASLASVLVEPCIQLPFIVSLWGGTGIGKTVVLMLATSIWANPEEGAYMTDAKATAVAMEVRLNVLNSLPMTIDDMAQVKNQYDEDFSQLIYRWCAGKGKDRSNQHLGLNQMTSWHNCTITNGERSLVDETTQGGAVNRVIDIESDGSVLFNGEDGNRVAKILKENYGWLGSEFVEVIEELGFEEIRKIVNNFVNEINKITEGSKEDKQIMPMALILSADYISEKYIYKDGITLDINKCCGYLKNKGEVSEHKRAYEYIKGFIASNANLFMSVDGDSTYSNSTYGKWLDNDTVAIVGTVFDKAIKQGGFQSKAFLSWANKQGLIETDNRGTFKKAIRINGVLVRCVILFIKDENYDVPQDFSDVDLSDIPF